MITREKEAIDVNLKADVVFPPNDPLDRLARERQTRLCLLATLTQFGGVTHVPVIEKSCAVLPSAHDLERATKD